MSNTDNYMDTNQDATIKSPLDESQAIASWFITDALPGSGNRPEWLESKYKSVEDQAKGYKEIRKAMGARSGAPEKYDLGEYNQYFDVSADEDLSGFLTYCKDNHLSQDAVHKVFDTFVNYAKKQVPDENVELEKIGSEKYERLQNWAMSNLSEKSRDAFKKYPLDAELVDAMEEIRMMHSNNQGHMNKMPTGNEQPGANRNPSSVEDITKELRENFDKYNSNADYRKDLEARLIKAVG